MTTRAISIAGATVDATAKTVTASDGTTVETAWWEVFNEDGPLVLEVSAQIGSVQMNQRMTFGAMDDSPEAVTAESMQAELDKFRLQLADMAVAHNAARQILAGIT